MMLGESKKDVNRVKRIISDAGGEIIGKTRLQKIGYLFNFTRIENNFDFTYKHYGPFSEMLAASTKYGVLLGEIQEKEKKTQAGNSYFVYTVDVNAKKDTKSLRSQLAKCAIKASAIELELATTALYLFNEDFSEDPWQETKRRKPEKTQNGELARAYKLFGDLKNIAKNKLPDLPKPNVTVA